MKDQTNKTMNVLLPTREWVFQVRRDEQDLFEVGMSPTTEHRVERLSHNARSDAERALALSLRADARRRRREKAIRNRRHALREKGYSAKEIREIVARMPRG